METRLRHKHTPYTYMGGSKKQGPLIWTQIPGSFTKGTQNRIPSLRKLPQYLPIAYSLAIIQALTIHLRIILYHTIIWHRTFHDPYAHV